MWERIRHRLQRLWRSGGCRTAGSTTQWLTTQERPHEQEGEAAELMRRTLREAARADAHVLSRTQATAEGYQPEESLAGRGSQLDIAREAFLLAMTDLRGEPARDLGQRVQAARSVRELWHLRPELYQLVARHRTQSEADRRLAALRGSIPEQT